MFSILVLRLSKDYRRQVTTLDILENRIWSSIKIMKNHEISNGVIGNEKKNQIDLY